MNGEETRQLTGVLVIGLLIWAIYFFSPAKEGEPVQVEIENETYTVPPDSTLEFNLNDSSKIHINYRQLTDSTTDANSGTPN